MFSPVFREGFLARLSYLTSSRLSVAVFAALFLLNLTVDVAETLATLAVNVAVVELLAGRPRLRIAVGRGSRDNDDIVDSLLLILIVSLLLISL